MKPAAFAYHRPTDLDGALSVLAELGDDGKVLAGGQSLVPMMNMRLVAPAALVDITRIEALGDIEVSRSEVRVGATVTHEQLRRDADVARACPLLTRALDWVAHPVIRNRGTAVGSIVHADPAAELPAVLALLNGHVELRHRDGHRLVEASDFIVGPLESDLHPGELATGIVIPVTPARTGTAFTELARRHGDYALAGVGVTVTLDEDGCLIAARAAFIGVGDGPVLVDLTDVLAGQPHDALRLEAGIAHVRGRLDPSADIHASAGYRRHLAGVLVGRALTEAALTANARVGGPADDTRAGDDGRVAQ